MPKAYSYLRFSTPEQSQGDSYRRQTDLSRAYAAEHGLDLDENFTFQDLGVSAFRGDNIIDGALGQFIKAVDRGVVPSGSYLLVESLDRLSRDRVMEALERFMALLRKGIAIVTLIDRKTYTHESLNDNPFELMGSLMIMFRAHEESATKSKRLKEAWEAKRDKAQAEGKPLTAKCPAWLSLSPDGLFLVDEEKAALVSRIFEMTLSGQGKTAIVRVLNGEGIKSIGKGKGWHPSYIQKLLTNPAVIGDFIPHRVEVIKGKKTRIPNGEPIKGYFPAIVSDSDFWKAQQVREARRIPSGRRGKRLSNLFTGLVVCGSCGAPMHLVNKGKPPKGGKYLVCSSAKRGLGDCPYHSWQYPSVEEFIVLALNEVDYRELFPRIYRKTAGEIRELEDKLATAKASLTETGNQLGRVVGLLVERDSSPALLSKLDELEQKKTKQESLASELTKQLATKRELNIAPDKRNKDANDALNLWITHQQSKDQDKAYSTRAKLAAFLTKLVDSIIFLPSTNKDYHGEITVTFEGEPDYRRLIKIKQGQQEAVSYKLVNGSWLDRKLLKRLDSGRVKRITKGKTKTIEKFPSFNR